MVKIFIGNLTEESDPIALRGLFEQFGKVSECDVLGKFGFVHMESEEQAKVAIAALDGHDFMGVNIDVKMSHGKGKGKGDRGGGGKRGGGKGPGYYSGGGPVKIFCGNLSEHTKSDDIRELFEEYGEVTECDVLSRYGFVHMANLDEAETAIAQLHGHKVDGFSINVELSHGKSKRDGGGPSFERGRGRGRGRGARYDPYGRDDAYPRDAYDRPLPPPPGYDRDPYGRLPPPPRAERDPYDPYRRDPYARDPYGRDDPYLRARDAYLDRDPYDLYRRDPYLYARDPYARERDPYARARDPYARERDPYTRERDPYSRPPPAYYDYETVPRRPAEESLPSATTADPYATQSQVTGRGKPYAANGFAPVASQRQAAYYN